MVNGSETNVQTELFVNYIAGVNDIDDATFNDKLYSQCMVKRWLSNQVDKNKMVDKSEINIQLVNVKELDVKTKSISNINDEFSTVSEGQTTMNL